MARQTILCLACLIGAALASEECPAGICPDVSDETSFFQRFLKTRVRSEESQQAVQEAEQNLKVAEGEYKDKWQALRETASEEPVAPEASTLSLIATRLEETTGLGMGTGWWILLFMMCCCCCGPAVVFVLCLPFLMVATKKPLGEFSSMAARDEREKFDKECPPDDQERYNWHTPTGAAFKKKCDGMFAEANNSNKGVVEMKDLKDIVTKYDAKAGEAFSKGGSIDKDEFYEMLKYFEWKKDVENGVFANKGAKKTDSDSSSSSSDSDCKKNHHQPQQAAAASNVHTLNQQPQEKQYQHRRERSRSSSSGGGGDMATGVVTGIVATELVETAMSDSD